MAKKTKAILCVDDETIVLESLKEQLMQSFGNEFIIETAESGEEALELIDFLASRSVDTLLIISDWLMPEMRGDELMVKIHRKFPKIAKIMLSGQAEKSAVDNAFKNAKMDAFMSKPWKREELVQKIKSALS